MLKVLKLFQDIKSQWDSILYIFIYTHQLKPDLEAFFNKYRVKFLRLDKKEWSQIEYLINIIKPFYKYI